MKHLRRSRHDINRDRRAIAKAIRDAGSETTRNELCIVAQRNGL